MRFVKYPCGIICLIITYIMVIYAYYVVMRWIILQTMQANIWAPLHVVSFNTVVFLLAMSHLKAELSDPGCVPLPANRLDFSDMHTVGKSTGNGNSSNEWTVCTRCETYRPPRAHHCRICKRCIRRMDHHCPWINNCVGERNQKYFLQFLVYVGVQAIYSACLVLGSLINPCEGCNSENIEGQTRLLHCVILLIESALFGLFVLAIMVDQMHAILYDETAIEQAQQKGSHRPNRRKFYLLADVFGRGHPACWLLPCTSFNSSSSALRYYDTPLLSHEV
ncbi:palmitoyltransferase ZDHHC3-like [Glossina fuscipes]|uniref:Palmitoyltransferase n=2 Tax=Glossina fuscipes TaxID=7396 RepID=A0A9C5ZLC6_9MUSC|nr:palmitoyltransferase ZDHHC3-like [Glossina fuscipes]